MPVPTDYFALTPIIELELSAIPGLRFVGNTLTLDDALCRRSITPAAWVVLADLQPLELNEPARRLYTLEVIYNVALIIAHAGQTWNNEEVHQIAGPMLAAITEVMCNKKMHEDFTRFRPARVREFRKSLPGFGMFILGYSSEFTAAYESNLS